MVSNVTSACKDIGHGCIDFAVGTFHDFCMGVTYLGNEALEFNIYERMSAIVVEEESQANQMLALEHVVMGLMNIDESDTCYQSFRSGTTTRLEVDSLVVGGVGVAKGAFAAGKIFRGSKRLTKIAELSVHQLRGSNGFFGHKGFQMKNFDHKALKNCQRIRNNPTNIQGLRYTGHALDQMQNRGFTPSVVEEAKKNCSRVLGKEPLTVVYYDEINKTTIVLNTKVDVITISYGVIKQ